MKIKRCHNFKPSFSYTTNVQLSSRDLAYAHLFRDFNSLKNISSQKVFMDNIARKMNIHSPEGWYQITKSTIFEFGGKDLLDKYYQGSISKLLQTVYPEYLLSIKYKEYDTINQNKDYLFARYFTKNPYLDYCSSTYLIYKWNYHKFRRSSPRHWLNVSNQQNFVNKVVKKLNIQSFSDWQNITANTIKEFGGQGLMRRYRSLSEGTKLSFILT